MDANLLEKAFASINNDILVKFIRKNFYNVVWVEKWGITTEHCELNNIKKLQQKANEIQAMGIIDVIDEVLC